MKYIIDTDPGIDDAIAIAMACLYKLDIIGFTLTCGNVSLENVEKNMKTIQDFLKTDIKMYSGEEKECVGASHAHGKYGLGNAVYPESTKTIEKMKADDFLIESSKKYAGNLTVICFGSLTNIANAIKKDPEFAKRLSSIYIMGTSYNPNDKIPYLEFNVLVDPSSAKLVFETEFNEVKVISHEAAVDTVISKEYIDSLKDSDNLISNFVYQISEKYIEFNQKKYGIDGISAPDPLTVASIIDPDVVKFTKASVKIIDEGDRRAESVVTLNEGNVDFCTEINFEKFEKMFKEVFK